ncbi:hypothetical protein Dimus_010162 [Dionaea muscipula]
MGHPTWAPISKHIFATLVVFYSQARLDILIIACLGHCQPMVTNVQVLVTFGRQSLPLCFLVVLMLFGWTIKQMVNLIQGYLFWNLVVLDVVSTGRRLCSSAMVMAVLFLCGGGGDECGYDGDGSWIENRDLGG